MIFPLMHSLCMSCTYHRLIDMNFFCLIHALMIDFTFLNFNLIYRKYLLFVLTVDNIKLVRLNVGIVMKILISKYLSIFL